MKIAEIIGIVKEHPRDWDDHPYVKLVELYTFYKNIHDINLKVEICKELLENIDTILFEFKANKRVYNTILQMKYDMETLLKGR